MTTPPKNPQSAAPHKILFKICGDALLVANTGKGFSREGVISICNMDLSAKGADANRTPEDIYGNCEDRELVREIADRRMSEYERNINRLKEDANREDGVQSGYAGRFLWELIQNAEDAASGEVDNTQLIGTKGLGFKSVLEISDAPEIYSGDFRFHFSHEKSAKKLKELPAWNSGMGVPLCRIPHAIDPDEAVRAVLDAGYVTVIRLPLKEDKVDSVRDELDGLHGEALLFCRHLQTVEIETDDDSRRIVVDRSHGKRGADTVKVRENDGVKEWRVWRERKAAGDGDKQLDAAVALPVVRGKRTHLEKVPYLHVFFPTQAKVAGVHALVHASLEVEDNRKHLSDDQSNLDKICELLKGIVAKILASVPPSVALHAFARADGDSSTDDATAAIAATILATVRETAFVPVIGDGKAKPKAKPGEVRLWKYGLGEVLRAREVRGENLCDTEIKSKARDLLRRKLGADELPLVEHARLLQHCHKATPDNCIAAWNCAVDLMTNAGGEVAGCAAALNNAPFWRTTAAGKARAINGPRPLCWTRPKDCPEWLNVDVVAENFRQRIREEEARRKKKDGGWKNPLSGRVAPLSNTEYFDGILLWRLEEPDPDPAWWQAHGWDVLKMALRWWPKSGKEELLVLNQSIPVHAEIVHLPVDGGEWRPAWQCYAGTAWGGPKVFDAYFAGVADRYLVAASEHWGFEVGNEDEPKWRNLLAWLGCSWMPKLVWQVGPHPKRHLPAWNQWKDEYFFEHWDEMLSGTFAFDCVSLSGSIPRMHELASQHEATYTYFRTFKVPSYALQQLQNNAWVFCKSSLLFPEQQLFVPGEAYLPDCGLGGLLPEVDEAAVGEFRWPAVKQVLEALGAKSELADDPGTLVGYMNELAARAAVVADEDLRWDKERKNRGRIARGAMAIFDRYSTVDMSKYPSFRLPADTQLPCLRLTDSGERVHFAPKYQVYWADEAYFDQAEIRQKILLAEDIYVFFRFLSGESGGDGFGLRRLSEHMDMQAQYTSKCIEESDKMQARYDDRRIGLELATGTKLPAALRIAAFGRIALQTAKLDIEPEVRFWKVDGDENRIAVSIDSDEFDKWHCLAAALGEVGACKAYAPDFENLLREESTKKFLARLRNGYGLSAESVLEAEESIHEATEDLPDDPPAELALPVPVIAESDEPATVPYPAAPVNATPAVPAINEQGQTPDAESPPPAPSGYARDSSPTIPPSYDTSGIARARSPWQGGHRASAPRQSTPGVARQSGRSADAQIDQEARQKAGLKAEAWLKDKLKSHPAGFVVTPTGRGSDCKVALGGRHIFVEVKHIDRDEGDIHWSKTQIETAEDCRANEYCVVVVRGKHPHYTAVSIFFDPLTEFVALPRECVWTQTSEGVAMPEENGWNAPGAGAQEWKEGTYSVSISIEHSVLEDALDNDFQLLRDALMREE